jgi:hypothetical protein
LEKIDSGNALEVIKTESLQRTDGTNISLCKFLEGPDLGLSAQSASQGGPRPRIGNGWKVTQDQDKGDKIENQKKVVLAIKEIQAKAKPFPGLGESTENVYFNELTQKLKLKQVPRDAIPAK